MNIKHTITISAISIMLATSAVPAYAIVGGENKPNLGIERAEKMEEKIGEKKEANTERLRTKANTEIDKRVAALSKLIEKITAMKKLTTTQKTSLTTEVQNEISTLTTLKAKIASDTDITTLRTDTQSIVKSFRVYALFMPKIAIIANADRILETIDDLSTISTKLKERMTAAKTAGVDTTAMQTALDDMTAKMTDASTQANLAITTVTGLLPEGFPANKTSLESARKMLGVAQSDLKNCQQNALKIRQLLKAMPKAKTTATPSAGTQ